MRVVTLIVTLVLVPAFPAAAPENAHHVLSGVMPNLTYEIRIDGVKVLGLEPGSDDIGLMEFWTPYAGPGVHTLEFRPRTEYELTVGACSVAPIN